MKSYKLDPNYLKFLLITVIALGIFFRFANLDKKVYWIDEVHTSVRVAGYKKTEFVDQAPSDRIIKIDDLLRFQQLSPQRGWDDTIEALAGNAEHTPLYYAIARLAMQVFGSSIAVTRGVAAAFSLFVFPCVYWLCLELFASPLVAWVAMALIAVSPLHVLYAQEAREYSLLTVTILLSSAALLRAKRQKTRSSWGVYALTVALGLYSHLIFVLVNVAHGIYILISGRSFIKYIFASLIGLLSLVPWIILYFINASSIGEWTAREIGINTLAKRWLTNLTTVFFDLQTKYNNIQFFDVEGGNDTLPLDLSDLGLFIVPVVVLVLYSIYILYKFTPRSVWLFILILIIVPASSLVLPDLISGGQRSSIARYLIPTYIGIQLAVAYAFANRLTYLRHWQQRLWAIGLIVVLSGGILSSVVSLQAQTWWNKYSGYYNIQVAELINQTQQPLVISSQKRVSRSASLSYNLNPQTSILLVSKTDIPDTINNFSDVFLFRPDAELYAQFASNPNYQLKILHAPGQLWSIRQLVDATITGNR